MDKHSHLLGIDYLDDRCSVTKTRGENLKPEARTFPAVFQTVSEVAFS
jgi:hypothetical protein